MLHLHYHEEKYKQNTNSQYKVTLIKHTMNIYTHLNMLAQPN